MDVKPQIKVKRTPKKDLIESDEKYKLLINTVTDVIYTISPEGIITSLNPAFEKNTGWKCNDFIGTSFTNLIHPDDLSYAMEIHYMIQSGQKPPVFELRFLLSSGIYAIVEFSITPMFKDGKVIGTLGIARDITERRNAEEELRKYRDFLEELVEKRTRELIIINKKLKEEIEERKKIDDRFRDISYNTADWIWEIDKNGKYTFSSGQAEKILGYNHNELIGKSFFDLLVPKELEVKIKYFKDVISEKRSIHNLENWCFKKNRKKVCLLTNGLPISDKKGELIGYRGIHKDITEQKLSEEDNKRLEYQLLHAQKMEAIGTLAGGIAHDFNNILGAIIGYSEMTIDHINKEDVVYKNLNQILTASYRAKELVKQILTISRKRKYEKSPVRISLIIKEAIEFLKASIPSTIKIRRNIKTNSSMVISDPTQIHQIIMNLSTNAYHAMLEKGGILEIILEDIDISDNILYKNISPGPYVKLSVRDTGYGIPNEIVEKIFEPYFTTKVHGEGTGLGLAVVLSIVKDLNGEIIVLSKPGFGTTFNILLPRIKSYSNIEEKSDKDLPRGKERILIVEDEKNIAYLIQYVLKNLGYRIKVKTNSIQALELFKKNPEKFDLIITDENMPGITGSKLSQEALAIRPDIPIVLCTGYSEYINKDSAWSLGIREFMIKPINKSEIALTVRKVLDKN